MDAVFNLIDWLPKEVVGWFTLFIFFGIPAIIATMRGIDVTDID